MPRDLTYQKDFPIGAIKAFPKNPRRHGSRQVSVLATSIRKYGMINPIVIDDDDEVIAGHGRLLAAQKLGLHFVPIIRAVGLSASEKRALRIADNKLAERSAWDKRLLNEQLELLIKDDFDMELTGFDDIEIEKLVTGESDDSDDEPPVAPPPKQPVSRLGDVWACDRSLILCGDSREFASFEAVLVGDHADLTITDVPYNVAIPGNVSGLGRQRHGDFAMASGEMSKGEFAAFLDLVLGHVRTASRDGALVYVFIDWRSVADLVALARRLFAELKNIIAWVKPNGGMGAFYRSQHEFIAIFKHGRGKHCNNVQLGRLGRSRSNVWQYPGASGFSKSRDYDLADHPTVKPLRLLADAIRDASMPGDLVLDPFGGAGTTLLAAEQVGRRAALIEIDPAYVDVTLRRFEEQTGVEPLLMPDRIPLSVVRAERSATLAMANG